MLWLLACVEPQAPLALPGAPAPDVSEHIGSTVEPLRVGLVLNEVMTSNTSAVAGPSGIQDWLELYNAGPDPVDLSRVRLQEGGSTWKGEGTLEPGQHLLLWEEDLPFGLGHHEGLALWHDEVLLDSAPTGELPDDVAMLRYPDGGDWAFSLDATPGFANRAPSDTLDPSDGLFGAFVMLEVDLEVSDENLAQLDQARETKVPARVTIDGLTMDIGLRLKGRWGSRREIADKTSWKLDFNHLVPEQRFRGLEGLALNNLVQDPTAVHEYLTYSVYRSLDMPAPRSSWAWVRLNGEDYGLFSVIEPVDDRFLRRWWDDHTGVMYEGAYGVDFEVGEEQLFELDEGSPDERRSDLLAVIGALAQTPTEEALPAVEAVVDLDQFLLNQAIEVNLLHWDGYTTSNNYRVYADPRTSRFQIIPWGADQTWVDNWYQVHEGRGRVFTWCLQVPSCQARYDQAVLDVADHIETMDLAPLVEELLDWLEPWAQADPNREWSSDQRDGEIALTYETIAERPDQLRGQLD